MGFSPLTGIWVIRLEEWTASGPFDGSFSPLTGIWVIRRPKMVNLFFCFFNCFSPLTGIWVIRLQIAWLQKRSASCFSPLTGIWVIRLYYMFYFNFDFYKFQSPYGDLGNTTLSPSTRSGSGLTGDFFKPPAFFPFFGDPGEK